MLSIFDLLAAKTLDLDLAAYLMARISRGSSFMVGSVPGGAGKTTVMCALLNFVPLDTSLIAATRQAVDRAASPPPRACYICHEIGSGAYFAYLWADALQAYCKLSEHRHILATNLHADDMEQARDQICGANNVPLRDFNRFELLIFLRIDGDYFKTDRWIEEVYSGDGSSEHALIFSASQDKRTTPQAKGYLADSHYVDACREFLRTAPANVRTIEQTRQRVAEFLRRHPAPGPDAR